MKGMAYKQFNGVPMYLEWAPVQIFKEKAAEPVKKQEEEEEKVKEEEKKEERPVEKGKRNF